MCVLSVSAPFVPIPLGDTRDAWLQQLLDLDPLWVGPGGHPWMGVLQERVRLIIPSPPVLSSMVNDGERGSSLVASGGVSFPVGVAGSLVCPNAYALVGAVSLFSITA